MFSSLPSLIAALGGYELIRFLWNSRSNRRLATAQADSEEFRSLREYNEFLQQQLRDAGERYSEQTALVRSLNSEILTLTRQKAVVDLELAMKRCEVRSCPNRQPQNGY